MSLIAARDALTGGARGWRNPYVTDGLVAMWDGEWNAGGGVHDPAASVWKDLSGNGFDFSLVAGNSSWGDKYLLGAQRTSGRIGAKDISSTGMAIGTIEFVGNPYSWYQPGGTQLDTGVILVAGFSNGVLCLRIRGYANRKVMQLMTVASASPWYGHGTTNPDNRIVALSADIAGGKAYAFGEEITPYSFFDNRPDAAMVLGGFANGSAPYIGNINAIRIHSNSLTAAEIAANYAVDKARFNLP